MTVGITDGGSSLATEQLTLVTTGVLPDVGLTLDVGRCVMVWVKSAVRVCARNEFDTAAPGELVLEEERLLATFFLKEGDPPSCKAFVHNNE